MSDIDPETPCCWSCGTISVGMSMDEVSEGCPECGSHDLASFADYCQESDDSMEEYQSQGGG